MKQPMNRSMKMWESPRQPHSNHVNIQETSMCLILWTLYKCMMTWKRANALIIFQFSQIEIALWASTRCLCLCLLCLQVDILCCYNVQICMPQNTIWNTILLALTVWETLCRFAKVNLDLTTQLSIIITGLLTPNFACNV